MFERMETAESISEVFVELSYKEPTWVDANRSGHSRNNRVHAALSKTRSTTGERTGKRQK